MIQGLKIVAKLILNEKQYLQSLLQGTWRKTTYHFRGQYKSTDAGASFSILITVKEKVNCSN